MYPALEKMIANSIKRVAVSESSSDNGNYAKQKINYRGTTGNAEMLLPYGHHANIPANTLAVMLRLSADSENRVAIPMSGRNRIKGLAEGEVVYFHPDTHSYLWFKANGDIDIHSENDINIDANIINIDAETINITATETNLTSETINIDSTTITENFETKSMIGTTLNITANVNITGATAMTGALGVSGAMTNANIPVGNDHDHNYTWTHDAGNGVTQTPNP